MATSCLLNRLQSYWLHSKENAAGRSRFARDRPTNYFASDEKSETVNPAMSRPIETRIASNNGMQNLNVIRSTDIAKI